MTCLSSRLNANRHHAPMRLIDLLPATCHPLAPAPRFACDDLGRHVFGG